MAPNTASDPSQAVAYARIRRRLALVAMGLDVVWLWGLSVSGPARAWADRLDGWAPWPWAVAVYVAGLAGPWTLALLPLDAYRGHVLEHRFGLSRQTWWGWGWRWTKGQLLGGAMLLATAVLLMGTLRASPAWWWAWTAAAWIAWSVVLTQWMPVVLLPIFYRQQPLGDEGLRERLSRLAARSGAPVRGVYEIDFSRETAKANACLCGLGATRRILLTDTMTQQYTPEEIEAVLAHELGHQRLQHLSWSLTIGAVGLVASCALLGRWLPLWLAALRIGSLQSLAALPVIALALTVIQLVLIPVHHGVSRRFERAADRFALELTRAPQHFIAAMRKLQRQNLAEDQPSPWVEWFWYDHPPIAKRVAMAEQFR